MDHFIGQLATIGDRFSDYTITLSGGETFNTHRIVLYLHSPVFAAFLDKKSKDKEEDEISINYLEDEDPDAFRAMLHFFYHNSYDAPDSASALVLHVAVHHIAEKYEVSALRDRAYDSFQGILLSDWNSQGLVGAAAKLEELGCATPRAEEMKRDIVLAISKNSRDLFDCPAFKSFIQTYPHWAIRLLKVYDAIVTSAEEGDGVALDAAFDEHRHDHDGGEGGNDGNDGGGGEGGNWGYSGTGIFPGEWSDGSNLRTGAAFSGPGRVIGPSNRSNTNCVYGQGGRKPASKPFAKKAAAGKQLGSW